MQAVLLLLLAISIALFLLFVNCTMYVAQCIKSPQSNCFVVSKVKTLRFPYAQSFSVNGPIESYYMGTHSGLT